MRALEDNRTKRGDSVEGLMDAESISENKARFRIRREALILKMARKIVNKVANKAHSYYSKHLSAKFRPLLY